MYLNQNKSESIAVLVETIVIDLINVLHGINIELIKIYFKEKAPKQFQYLLIVNNDSLLMDNYSALYKSAHDIKTKYLDQGLNVDFSFIGNEGLVDQSVFISEGWLIGSYINEIQV